VALLIVIALIIALAAFGFFWHVLWLGVLVGVVALLTRLVLIGLDADRPAGRLNINVLHSFGRYLLEISERARRRGRRSDVVDNAGAMTEEKTDQALAMARGGMTQAAIGQELGVSSSTVSRHLRARRKQSKQRRATSS
jgi:DNA invertase Pin-like site-specific DNA recombinase